MKKLLMVLSGAILLFAAQNIWAKTATSSTRSSRVVNNIKDVRTVYVRKIEGDREFARRLMNEIRSCGLRFVDSPRNANALLSARGDYENGAFYGSMKFVNRSGKTLWSASATRAKGRTRLWVTCRPLYGHKTIMYNCRILPFEWHT